MSRSVTRPTNSPGSPPAGWPEGLVFRPWQLRVARALAGVGLVALVLACGVWLGRASSAGHAASRAAPPSAGAELQPNPPSWTCSMHPQIKLSKPGPCPICYMDLIPVAADATADPTAPRLELSGRARALAQVATAPVVFRELTQTLRLVGKIAPDETTVTYITSSLPGRVVRLFARYTGMYVQEHEPLAEIFSPDLLAKQREFLLSQDALDRADRLAPDPRPRNERAVTTLEAPRRALQLWGLPDAEIDRLTTERVCTDRLTVAAPSTGWILERPCYQGLYVEPGTSLFTIVDLRRVWVLLDAYELDLPYLRYGQAVQFEAEAVPGRTFTGQIAYIDPRLEDRSRTVKVRVSVSNDGLQLRPGMFVHARLTVRVGAGGAVVENSLAGKWVSPVYPELIEDAPGTCKLSGLPLVPAESLGYATTTTTEAQVLAIPSSAVLLTGRRAIVYVERMDEGGAAVYEGREVELGPRADDDYIVLSGLSDGERVVTHGALQIDSALQIQAKPSMMDALAASATATSQPAAAGPESRALRGAAYHAPMHAVIDRYLALTAALVAANEATARQAATELTTALRGAQPEGLTGPDTDLFRHRVATIAAALPPADKSDVEGLRTALPALTKSLDEYLVTFGHDRPAPLIRIHCPMAFDNRGADWFHSDDTVLNPYFGNRMLRCGKRQAAVAADGREVR